MILRCALKKLYIGGKTKNRASELSKKMEVIQRKEDSLKDLINNISSISVNNNMSAVILSQTYLKKFELIGILLVDICALKTAISDPSLANALRKRVKQQESINNKLVTRELSEFLQFFLRK